MKSTKNTKVRLVRASRSRRRGSIAVMVALFLTLLLISGGFAVNYGLLAADANRVQRGCDAAATAALHEMGNTIQYVAPLPGVPLGTFTNNETAARNAAINLAAKNGVTVTPAQVVFTRPATSPGLVNKVTVTGTARRQFFFAGFLGRDSGTVTRNATATISPAQDMTTGGGGQPGSVAPIGITWDTYNAYRQALDSNGNRPQVVLTLIRQNKNTFSRDPGAVDQDPFVLFDLRDTNAKSGPHMQDQLTGDEVESVSLSDWENTLNASLNSEGKKLEDGIQVLLDRAKGAPWLDNSNTSAFNAEAAAGTISHKNPRVINLIVTPATASPKNGTFNTQVQGFAPVYINGLYEETVNGEKVMRLSVTFLPPAVLSTDNSSPDTTPTAWSGNYVTTFE